MKASLFCAIVCLFTVAAAVPTVSNATLSYGQLAQIMAPPAYRNILQYLPEFNKHTTPGQVETLRKSILVARDYLDIFVFAYPNMSIVDQSSEDQWKILRDTLDDGYEIIGDFQDLNHSDVDYSHHEEEKRRQICLDWIIHFENLNGKHNFALVVKSASLGHFFYRSSKDLSPFFWGSIQALPLLSLSALQNVALMERSLIQVLASNFPIITTLEKVYKTEKYDILHEYRKVIRSVIAVESEFAIMNHTAACVKVGIAFLDQLYSQIGNLGNKVFEYQFYSDNGDNGKAKRKKEEIVVEWATIQAYFTPSLGGANFACLAKNVPL